MAHGITWEARSRRTHRGFPARLRVRLRVDVDRRHTGGAPRRQACRPLPVAPRQRPRSPPERTKGAEASAPALLAHPHRARSRTWGMIPRTGPTSCRPCRHPASMEPNASRRVDELTRRCNRSLDESECTLAGRGRVAGPCCRGRPRVRSPRENRVYSEVVKIKK